MRLNMILVRCLCLVFGMLMACELAAATYYVAPSGNDSNSGTRSRRPLRTIRQAASKAQNGDSVHVAAGVYSESVDVIGRQGTSPLQFIASEPGAVTIGGQVNVVDSNGVSFSGFVFAGNADRLLTWQGSYGGTVSACEFRRGRQAVLVKDGSLTLVDCKLQDFSTHGVEIDGAAKLFVTRTQISGCQGSAIKVLKNAQVELDNADIRDNTGDGIQVATDPALIPVTGGTCNCTGTTPQSMRQEAYDLLAGVNPQEPVYAQAISDARGAISSSLASHLWHDGWTATASGGPVIYDRSKTAIELLNAVYTDNIDFFISGNDVIVNQPFTLSAKVLGAEISNGSLYQVPVTTNLRAGSTFREPWGPFTSPTQGNVNDSSNPRDYTDPTTYPAGTSVSVSGRSWLKTNNAYSGTNDSHWMTYLAVSSSSQSANLKVLRDGDAVPNLAGFGGQAPASSFLQSYIENGRIALAKNQAVFLFELGTTNLSSSAADFQDLVILLTLRPTSMQVTQADADLILQAMLLLLEADKNLASCAISTAKCAGGDAGTITEAEAQFDAGLREAAAEHFEQATVDFQAAWVAAQNSRGATATSGATVSTSPQKPSGWTDVTQPLITVQSSSLVGNHSGVAIYTPSTFNAQGSDFSQNQQWGVHLRGEVALSHCTIDDNGVAGVCLVDATQEHLTANHVSVRNNVEHGLLIRNSTLSFHSDLLQRWSISGSKRIISAEASDLSFHGVTLSGGTTAALTMADGTLTATNSTFSDNGDGIYVVNSNVTMDGCNLLNNAIGLHAEQNQALTVRDSTLDGNLEWGVQLNGPGRFVDTSISGNGIGGLKVFNTSHASLSLVGSSLNANASHGLFCSASILEFNALTFNSTTTTGSPVAVMVVDSDLTFDGVTISGGTDYGVTVENGTLHLVNSTLTGNGTGLYLDAGSVLIADGTSFTGNAMYGAAVLGHASFQDCSLDHNKHGLYLAHMTDANVTSSGTTLSNNVDAGLHLDACNLTLTGTGIDGLTLTDNRYGIYATNSTLLFDGFTSNSNHFGVWLETCDATLTNSTLTGSTYGLWAANNHALIVESCTFHNNSSYGAYLTGNGSFHNCSITNNGGGLYVNGTGVTDETLTGTEIRDNTGYGLYVYQSAIDLTSQSTAGWSIDGNGYNLAGYQAAIMLIGANLSNATTYGLLAQYGSVHVQQSMLTSQQNGIGVFNADTFTVDRSWISSSGGVGHAIVNYASGLSLRNSVVSGAQYGVYSYDDAKPVTIYNTTIADAWVYGIYAYSGHHTVMNTILSGAGGGCGLYCGAGATVAHSYNLISGFATPFENTSADATERFEAPQFVDAANQDYRLAKGSPAINAGADLSASIPYDMLGNPRPSHRVFEIGAYEYLLDGGSLRILSWQEKR